MALASPLSSSCNRFFQLVPKKKKEKTLENRMKACMQQITVPSQTIFVPRTCIYDIIFLANIAMTYALDSNKQISHTSP